MHKTISKSAKKTIINIVVLVVLIGVTLTVLLLSYKELNFANIAAFLRTGEKWCIASAFLCMLGFIFFEGLSLWIMARSLGHKSRIYQSMAYASADVYYSAITPSASGGQPASLVYMRRDGMSTGFGGFLLMLNLLAYTASIFVIGAFAIFMRPQFVWEMTDGLSITLIIVGAIIQVLLFAFFVLCLTWSKLLVKMGNGVIGLFGKIRIFKNPAKVKDKWGATVEKYSASRRVLKSHGWLLAVVFLMNICQRVSQTLIPCFVCYAVSQEASFIDLFCMQVYVLLGYGSIPLPGGVGVYELMYLSVYGIFYEEKFILSSMMISRAISYYMSMIVSGLFTLVYHAVGIKKTAVSDAAASETAVAEVAEVGESAEGAEDSEDASAAPPEPEGE